MNQFERAHASYQDALNIYRQHYVEESPEIQACYANISTFPVNDQIRKLFRQSNFSEESPENTFSDIGLSSSKSTDAREARTTYPQCIYSWTISHSIYRFYNYFLHLSVLHTSCLDIQSICDVRRLTLLWMHAEGSFFWTKHRAKINRAKYATFLFDLSSLWVWLFDRHDDFSQKCSSINNELSILKWTFPSNNFFLFLSSNM